MAAVIEVAGLTKRYGGQAVVEEISFHVDQGEIFGILGPNGAGKTTTVECLEGLRRRDAGQVRILGLDPRTDARRLHQRIGVQLQETQLPEKLKVREALEMYASFYPDPADWQELLERWDLISQVRDGGVTVVLVSHFMDEVEELCDRVAILDRGRIAALDTPARLVDLVGAAYRVRFRPMAPLEEQSLTALPGVASVTRHGTSVDVSGTGDFASAVTAELARRQVVVADLRIEGRSLDSAYVALTGRTMDT